METAKRVTTHLVEAAEAILEGPGTRDEKLQAVCRLLADRVAHYDRVGLAL